MLAWMDTDVDAGWSSDGSADSLETNLGDGDAVFMSQMSTGPWNSDVEWTDAGVTSKQLSLDNGADVPVALSSFVPAANSDAGLRQGLCSDQSYFALPDRKVPVTAICGGGDLPSNTCARKLTSPVHRPKATGRKRSAEAAGVADNRLGSKVLQPTSKASKKRGCSAPDDNALHEDRSWLHLIELLADESFSPGVRPDRIEGARVDPGLMFKEHPKRRRGHSSAAKTKDKWFNTGGIKSASDRFDAGSGFGLRKRYGKVVREGGLPVLKFQEFSLLRKLGSTLVEEKNGPSLFHIVPPGAKRGALIPFLGSRGTASKPPQEQPLCDELAAVRRRMRDLQGELAIANETIKQQREELDRIQRKGVVTRGRKFTLPDGCK